MTQPTSLLDDMKASNIQILFSGIPNSSFPFSGEQKTFSNIDIWGIHDKRILYLSQLWNFFNKSFIQKNIAIYIFQFPSKFPFVSFSLTLNVYIIFYTPLNQAKIISLKMGYIFITSYFQVKSLSNTRVYFFLLSNIKINSIQQFSNTCKYLSYTQRKTFVFPLFKWNKLQYLLLLT